MCILYWFTYSVTHLLFLLFFFFSSRRRHTRYWRDWSSDVCSSDLDVHVCVVVPGDRRPASLDEMAVFLDPDRDAHHRYGAAAESLYLVRPDGYIAFRSQPAAAQPVLDHLSRLFTVRTTV